ncbi:putative lipoprotein [Vibrio cholerae]|nr:putative lipoprotein [Vibrio cholerae]
MKWFLAFWLVLTSCFSVSLYANDAVLQQAYQSQQSDLQVQGLGQVVKVLPDDNDGSRHQKFILKLNSGQTLLVAHNIDLAPRIPNLKVGDSVEFYGEYEWNKKGGVLHWTHKDPQNRHAHDWLKHNGHVYE